MRGDALLVATGRLPNHRYVPTAIFTEPQIATVGLTEKQAIATGFDINATVICRGHANCDTRGAR